MLKRLKRGHGTLPRRMSKNLSQRKGAGFENIAGRWSNKDKGAGFQKGQRTSSAARRATATWDRTLPWSWYCLL